MAIDEDDEYFLTLNNVGMIISARSVLLTDLVGLPGKSRLS
jgi:hypothetical protein